MLVALVAERIGECLVGRDPVDGGGHRRVAHFLTHEQQLLEQPIVSIDGIPLTKVADQDCEDGGRQLVLQDEDIVAEGDRVLELEVLVVDLVEVPARLADQVEVETGVISSVAKAGHHRLGGRLRCTPRQRREGRIDAGRPGFDRREVGNGRERGRRVGVNTDGQLGGARDRADQRPGLDRRQDTGDILDPDPVRAHGFQPAGRFDGARLVDHRARTVDERPDDARPRFPCRFNRHLEVSEVVERVEHFHDANAVFDGLLDERSHDIVGLVRLSEQRLAADQHLQRRLDDRSPQRAESLPRVFLECADGGREGPAAPGIEGVVPDVVQGLGDRQHVLQLEAALDEALLRIAQHGLGDQDLGHGANCMPGF